VLRSLVRIVLGVFVLGTIAFFALAIVLRQPTFTTLPFRAAQRADAARLERHVRFLTTEVVPRGASSPENLARAADYIAAHFRRAHARTSLQKFGRYMNVVAEFGPESSLEPLLVIGAHYDAFTETGDLPGADDNASGTAGLIELARLLGAHELTYPVQLVAYANEEPPFFGSELMGSAIHARSIEQRPVAGMICLEMIGYYSDQQSWPNGLFRLIYPSRGDFIGVTGGWPDRALTRTVKKAIAGAGGIRVVSFTGPRETSDASDHRNYWSRGWPAVMVTDTAFLRNPHYHTRNDTADTLDYRRMARVVDGVFNAAVAPRSPRP
jgi:Peptidase family M28